jgi:hypothetical protein
MKPTTQSFKFKKFRVMDGIKGVAIWVVMPLLALVFADLLIWVVDWCLLIYKGK